MKFKFIFGYEQPDCSPSTAPSEPRSNNSGIKTLYIYVHAGAYKNQRFIYLRR